MRTYEQVKAFAAKQGFEFRCTAEEYSRVCEGLRKPSIRPAADHIEGYDGLFVAPGRHGTVGEVIATQPDPDKQLMLATVWSYEVVAHVDDCALQVTSDVDRVVDASGPVTVLRPCTTRA